MKIKIKTKHANVAKKKPQTHKPQQMLDGVCMRCELLPVGVRLKCQFRIGRELSLFSAQAGYCTDMIMFKSRESGAREREKERDFIRSQCSQTSWPFSPTHYHSASHRLQGEFGRKRVGEHGWVYIYLHFLIHNSGSAWLEHVCVFIQRWVPIVMLK